MSFYPTSGYSKPQHVPIAHYTGLEANKINDYEYLEVGGGETGIRTPVQFNPQHAFQACALSHSAISPLP